MVSKNLVKGIFLAILKNKNEEIHGSLFDKEVTIFYLLNRAKRLISLIEKRNVANDEIKKYALKSLTELGDEGFIMVRQNKKKELCFVYHPLKTSLPNLGNVIIECNEI